MDRKIPTPVIIGLAFIVIFSFVVFAFLISVLADSNNKKIAGIYQARCIDESWIEKKYTVDGKYTKALYNKNKDIQWIIYGKWLVKNSKIIQVIDSIFDYDSLQHKTIDTSLAVGTVQEVPFRNNTDEAIEFFTLGGVDEPSAWENWKKIFNYEGGRAK